MVSFHTQSSLMLWLPPFELLILIYFLNCYRTSRNLSQEEEYFMSFDHLKIDFSIALTHKLNKKLLGNNLFPQNSLYMISCLLEISMVQK